MRFVSLGPTCETRWQLNRLLGVAPAHEAFDWQTTDFRALMFCLRSDFAGAFERQSLFVCEGSVRDTRFVAVYPHAFGGEPVAANAIETQYEAEREAFERRAERFREALRSSPEPVIGVRHETLTAEGARELLDALTALSRRPVQLLLLGDYTLQTRMPIGVIAMPFSPRDTYAERWQGDDAEWDEAVAPLVRCAPVATA